MPLRSSAYLVLAIACLNVAPAAGKVLLRVEAGPLPPAKTMGITEIVLHWPVRDTSSLAQLRSLGFNVFLQAGSNDLEAAANSRRKRHSRGSHR